MKKKQRAQAAVAQKIAAKAMVVTGLRLQAVKYMEAFQRYIGERGYDDIRPLVAFSGTGSMGLQVRGAP